MNDTKQPLDMQFDDENADVDAALDEAYGNNKVVAIKKTVEQTESEPQLTSTQKKNDTSPAAGSASSKYSFSNLLGKIKLSKVSNVALVGLGLTALAGTAMFSESARDVLSSFYAEVTAPSMEQNEQDPLWQTQISQLQDTVLTSMQQQQSQYRQGQQATSAQIEHAKQTADNALMQSNAFLQTASMLESSVKALQKTVENLQSDVEQLRAENGSQELGNIESQLSSLDRTINHNSSLIELAVTSANGAANRMNALESKQYRLEETIAGLTRQAEAPQSPVMAESTISLEQKHHYVVAAVSSRGGVALVKNTLNGNAKPLRVKKGSTIPGCGKVITLSAKDKTITTEQCEIGA